MAVSRLQEWRFHLVGTKRAYQSTGYIAKIRALSAFKAPATV